jgi:Ca-activated chloride channel family protein
VILATDGDFNVGVTSQQDLLNLIEQERESGVFLSVFGVGSGNLKDRTMEMLATGATVTTPISTRCRKPGGC